MEWLVIITIGLLLAVSWSKYRDRRAAAPVPAVRKQSGLFAAVSIEPARGYCCDACESLHGKRYLAREAPTLPLAVCQAAACNCRYRHHHDRRGGRIRREEDRGLSHRPAPTSDRRTHRERRLASNAAA